MSRNLLWFYLIVLICVMIASEPSTFQSIVLNFDVVLSLVMYIQGLSVIHFFGKAKDGELRNNSCYGSRDTSYTGNAYC